MFVPANDPHRVSLIFLNSNSLNPPQLSQPQGIDIPCSDWGFPLNSHVWRKTCSVFPFVSGSFHITSCLPVPCSLLQVTGLHSFLWLSSIPVCVCLNRVFFTHPSSDGQLGWFPSWLLWTMLQWTWWYRCLFKTMCFCLLGIYPVVELSDHMAV